MECKRTVGWFVLVAVVVAEALTVGWDQNWAVVVVRSDRNYFCFAVYCLVGKLGNSIVSCREHKFPRQEATIIRCGGDDELDVLGEIIFVALENSSFSSRVVAPCGEKFCWDLAVVILKDFADECIYIGHKTRS